jgi:hypothetical protein
MPFGVTGARFAPNFIPMPAPPTLAKPVIVLLGPYPLDREDGAPGFRDLLHRGLAADGFTVESISPQGYFGPLARSAGVARWLGYVDKYAIFLLGLLGQSSHIREKYLGRKIVVHICGQANAVYATFLRRWFPVVITCHDLADVSAARGEGGGAHAGPLQALLQKEVLHGLKRANAVVCVTPGARSDLLRLAGAEIGPHTELIPIPPQAGAEPGAPDAAATMVRAYEAVYLRV